MSRVSIATDPFTSTVNAALGGDWTSINTGTFGTITKQSGVFGGSHDALRAAARWSGAGTFTEDQYAEVIYVETDFASPQHGIGVLVRATTNANGTFYYLIGFSDNSAVMGVLVNGSNTDIATAAAGTITWNDGEPIGLEVVGANPNITLVGYKAGSPIGGAFTATGLTQIDSGKPGIMAAGSGFNATGDTFDGGNLVSATNTDRTPTVGAQVLDGVAPGRVHGTVMTPATPYRRVGPLWLPDRRLWTPRRRPLLVPGFAFA